MRPVATRTSRTHNTRRPTPHRKDGRMHRIPTLAVLAALLTPRLIAADNPILAPGAKLEKLIGDCKFTEGPAADRQGNVYFTDQPNDRILKYSAADGTVTEWMKPAGRSNGLCFDNNGQLIACADEKNHLWSINPETKQVTVLVENYNGKLLNGPNDVWVAPDNTIYFTDPLYRREYWKGVREPAAQQDKQAVYRLSADR